MKKVEMRKDIVRKIQKAIIQLTEIVNVQRIRGVIHTIRRPLIVYRRAGSHFWDRKGSGVWVAPDSATIQQYHSCEYAIMFAQRRRYVEQSVFESDRQTQTIK
jgi:hypothetical protein